MRTTNAIERRFREVRRRTRPMGTFQDRTSMERILFAVFMHENRNQGLSTPFALTQTSDVTRLGMETRLPSLRNETGHRRDERHRRGCRPRRGRAALPW